MKKSILAFALASSVSLGACTTNSRTAGDLAEGAAYGAAGGAAIGAQARSSQCGPILRQASSRCRNDRPIISFSCR